MQRDAMEYLWDISTASESIRKFTRGKSLTDYLTDDMLRAAVERKFGVMGEALAQLVRFYPDFRDRISLPEQLIAFRDQLIHGYSSSPDDKVWEIVTGYLPRLHQEVDQLLANSNA